MIDTFAAWAVGMAIIAAVCAAIASIVFAVIKFPKARVWLIGGLIFAYASYVAYMLGDVVLNQ